LRSAPTHATCPSPAAESSGGVRSCRAPCAAVGVAWSGADAGGPCDDYLSGWGFRSWNRRTHRLPTPVGPCWSAGSGGDELGWGLADGRREGGGQGAAVGRSGRKRKGQTAGKRQREKDGDQTTERERRRSRAENLERWAGSADRIVRGRRSPAGQQRAHGVGIARVCRQLQRRPPVLRPGPPLRSRLLSPPNPPN
jgi:hypothetical protein